MAGRTWKQVAGGALVVGLEGDMGIWDWYNKPGGRSTVPTRGLVLTLIALSFATGVLFMLLYLVVWPHVFLRAPG